ncbi:hypothetical protein Tsubulata_050626, partial [Turnera subulata]
MKKQFQTNRLRFDPISDQVTVLLRNLSAPLGVAVSFDGMYLVFSETVANRTQRYWLKGPKANTAEIHVSSIIRPNIVKRTASGDFLIAAARVDPSPRTLVPIGVRVDESGPSSRITSLSYGPEYGATRISEVTVWAGSCCVFFLTMSSAEAYTFDTKGSSSSLNTRPLRHFQSIQQVIMKYRGQLPLQAGLLRNRSLPENAFNPRRKIVLQDTPIPKTIDIDQICNTPRRRVGWAESKGIMEAVILQKPFIHPEF